MSHLYKNSHNHVQALSNCINDMQCYSRASHTCMYHYLHVNRHGNHMLGEDSLKTDIGNVKTTVMLLQSLKMTLLLFLSTPNGQLQYKVRNASGDVFVHDITSGVHSWRTPLLLFIHIVVSFNCVCWPVVPFKLTKRIY